MRNLQNTICSTKCFAMLLGLGVLAMNTGCDGRASLIPNKDVSLRKTATVFAADAAQRSYHADAPNGGNAVGRVEVNYGVKSIELANLSEEDWSNVEVWINQEYVVFVSAIPKNKDGDGVRHLNFQMFYNRKGEHLPIGLMSSSIRVNKVEIFRDGKNYNVPFQLGE